MPAKEKIRSLFDGIAPDYDRLNHILSLDIDKIWRRKAVKSALDSNGGKTLINKNSKNTDSTNLKILDVATGTGDFAIELARKSNEDTRITGLDISEGMLNIGICKTEKAGLAHKISFVKSAVEEMPFEDDRFDRITCAFGVRNFEDRELGLKEMHRVLAPGGKIVILELSMPRNKILRQLYDLYFKLVLPHIGGMVSGDKSAYEYLQASVHAFPPPEDFCDIIRNSGFSDVRTKSLSMGICRMFTASK